MIDVIEYEDGLTCTVFNEPFEDYYKIILDSNLDNHRLAKNYQRDILKEMEFMCLWKNDEKVLMYGLQRGDNLPSNVARVFSRFYIPESNRDTRALNHKQLKHVMSFYNDHPQYHTNLGIDTLFFTREVHGNKQDVLITKLVEKNGYKKLEEPRYYRKTLQHFYVLGNTNFVTAFPLSLVGPTK